MIKAGAQRVAAELGLALVACDTSPRARALPRRRRGLGLRPGRRLLPRRDGGAVVGGLPHAQLRRRRAAGAGRARVSRSTAIARGIFGHSMGGHGALVLALRHPERYRSVSAFAPIAAPSAVPWGEKAFSGYLGADRARWAEYDATALVRAAAASPARSWSTRARATSSSTTQLRPELLARRLRRGRPAARRCACATATTTATTSSRPSSRPPALASRAADGVVKGDLIPNANGVGPCARRCPSRSSASAIVGRRPPAIHQRATDASTIGRANSRRRRMMAAWAVR